MHDHDPRRSHFMVRASPPQVCEFMANSQNLLKQNHQQQQQYMQAHYHQMQHQQYQPHYIQQQHQISQQQLKKVSHDNQFTNFPTPTSASIANNDICNINDFEDVDEDQISDFDEEEELRLSYEQYRQNFRKQPDVTSQLLEFADMVSADIKKFFGRSKDQDDSCDVYADKWTTAKSGRELYYADLLRIAQGDTEVVSKTSKNTASSLSSPSSTSLSPLRDYDNRSKFSGKRDDSVGMGPLTELFEYKFSSFLPGHKEHRGLASVSRSKVISQTMPRSHKLAGRVVPMHERNFPESFWHEPCPRGNGLVNSCTNRLEISQHNVLSSSKLPDFSDLVESWQGLAESIPASECEQRNRTNNSVQHQQQL